MHRSSLFLTAALMGTTMALIQPVASAKSAVEVGRIATAVTVEIKELGKSRIGSGILLQHQGDIYTVLTAGHVVENGTAFTLKTSDGQVHKSITNSVKLSGNNLDLGVLKFRTTKNYTLAKIGTSNSLEALSPIYVAGFPESTYAIEAGTLNITKGEVIGNATKGNASGYSLIYSNTTFRGMSGGPVLNEAGELVAIHGQGDRDGKEGEGEKTGRNLGIVVERFGTVALIMGVQLEQRVAVLTQNQGINASDYFLRAYSKHDGGDYRGALADYNQAISLNPKYFLAYNNRANLKVGKLNDIPGALADYNQAISLNPKYSDAHYNRALLKRDKLNDIPGALADYNQAISLNPKYSIAYSNRGILKADKLNDILGALADYNQAISLNSKHSVAYNNRANLKRDKLNDIPGALADYNQAISLNPKYSDAYYNRANLKVSKLNDIPGALADYNQAISLNPKFAIAYNNRAILKVSKLNDIQGALNDFNQAIIINPKDSDAHYNRANLKVSELNDIPGAIQDLRQAARLFREEGRNQDSQKAIEALRKLGATE
jgi:tetratricopeptide (TPR) repeat protein